MADTGIYEIRNTINGKRYVGSAVLFKKRWKEHVRQLSDSRHHSVVLQRAWDRYGSEAFEFKPIIYCDRANLIMYEQIAMDALLPEYNVAPRAGSQLGFRMREEAKAKMSEAAKRTRNFTGKTHSEESRAKISASRMGKGGGPMSEERKAKIGAAHKGRIISDEQRAKISATLMGHKQSAEQIEKRVQKLRGRKMPDGFAEATSMRMTGSKLSAGHCMAIGKAKAKLSDDQVREIRRRRGAGEQRAALAAEFCIDAACITHIVARRSYAWVA